MTYTTIIIITNAILGAALAYAILGLLSLGISSDRDARQAQVRRLRRPVSDRLAA